MVVLAQDMVTKYTVRGVKMALYVLQVKGSLWASGAHLLTEESRGGRSGITPRGFIKILSPRLGFPVREYVSWGEIPLEIKLLSGG